MRSNNIIPTFRITETFWGWFISPWGPLTNTSKYNNITTFYTSHPIKFDFILSVYNTK